MGDRADVSVLLQAVGQQDLAYQEVLQDERFQQVIARWPLLARIEAALRRRIGPAEKVRDGASVASLPDVGWRR